MMRSLWAGVTGLQAHQVAMDVEGHNIANVNTVGYKYTRVSFADQISQTVKTATGPQGESGGRNAMQVGLGASVEAATKVFKTGSIETTDVGTDLAIESDGFFVVSDDGGKTYTYTRNGEFTRDAVGNLVNTSGYIVQGWMQDAKTKNIDTTGPIQNIVIPAGLTTEAKASDTITIKANLNSGDEVGKMKKLISSLDKFHGAYDESADNQIYNTAGDPLSGYQANEEHKEDSRTDYKFNKDQDIIEYAYDMGVMFNDAGSALALRKNQGMWVSYREAIHASPGDITGGGPLDIRFNLNGTLIEGSIGSATSTSSDNAQSLVKLINAQSNKTGVSASLRDGTTATSSGITLTNDNRSGTLQSTKNIVIEDPATGTFNSAALATTGTSVITAYKYQYVENGANYTPEGTPTADTVARTFTTTEDLRAWLQKDVRHAGVDTVTGTGHPDNTVTDVTVNELGQFTMTKASGGDLSPSINVAITGFSNSLSGDDGIAENSKFTSTMRALEGKITQVNSFRTSQSLYVSSLGASQHVFDSLGSKHTVSVQYTKIGKTSDNGTEWMVKVSVPQPGVINDTGTGLKNIVTGYVRFNEQGALTTFTPANISYSPNNGSAPNQNIKFDIGQVGGFDGLTSYDSASVVTRNKANGYPGGDLDGIRVDANGNVIGTFTNDKSFALAQIAVAKFTNNEGLETKGGNMFIQTSNSGEPIIGTANTGGRGGIKASSLEMSNVDLSRSLTQLIVVQRGFQANSKTITTSDQMLNTLLQLKQ